MIIFQFSPFFYIVGILLCALADIAHSHDGNCIAALTSVSLLFIVVVVDAFVIVFVVVIVIVVIVLSVVVVFFVFFIKQILIERNHQDLMVDL